MPLLQIALRRDGLCDIERPETGSAGVEAAIRAAAAGLPAGAPVVVMLHGRGYRPGDPRDCPHRLLYADRDSDGRSRYISWTRRMGLSGPGGQRHPGLAVGLGWDSAGSVWTAARAADGAAAGLARLVTLIRRALPDRPVDLLAHSLGARVALGALPLLHAGAVGRMILMAGADFVPHAEAALASPAGRVAEVVNVVSRENDLYDWMLETALGGGRALGAGLGHLPNAVDVQIDGRAARRGLSRLGFRLAEPGLRVCHWSVYLRPGVFPLYRALIHRRESLPLARLRAALAVRPDPRWMRLAEGPLPLPFAGRGRTLPL
jgi:pimeloyl-ACP methyl ester carboxylesterase